MSPRWRSTVLAAPVLAALVAIAGAVPAAAHAGFVAASPAPCDVVTDAARVVVDFDQPVAAGRSDLVVVDAAGEVVAAGEVASDDPLGGTLVADLERPLPAGDYRVEWRNVSLVDGDPGRGRYGFTVGGADAVAAPGCGHVAGDEAALAAGEGGGAPLAVIVGVGGGVVAAVLGFAVLRRRSSAAA